MIKSLIRSLLLFPGIAVVTAAPSSASMVTGWWGGNWTCNIDGRPARMKWVAASVTEGSCDGNVCSQSQGAAWRGHFSDNGSRWVPLSNPRKGAQGGVFFRHADGNQWYLAKPVSNRSEGWTTWQGTRYRLSCWR